MKVKKESIWGLSNLANHGSTEQVRRMLKCNALKAFSHVLHLKNDTTNEVALLGIISILQVRFLKHLVSYTDGTTLYAEVAFPS